MGMKVSGWEISLWVGARLKNLCLKFDELVKSQDAEMGPKDL